MGIKHATTIHERHTPRGARMMNEHRRIGARFAPSAREWFAIRREEHAA